MDETATLASSHTEMTEMVLPNQTNIIGRALGGTILQWMDICGAIAAMRFSTVQCVTAAMDHVEFKSPIDQGEIVKLEGYVYDTGRTSLEVVVDVQAEDPTKETEDRETTVSFFTFVGIDESGTPTPVPAVRCPTEREQRLRTAARQRRTDRLHERLQSLQD